MQRHARTAPQNRTVRGDRWRMNDRRAAAGRGAARSRSPSGQVRCPLPSRHGVHRRRHPDPRDRPDRGQAPGGRSDRAGRLPRCGRRAGRLGDHRSSGRRRHGRPTLDAERPGGGVGHHRASPGSASWSPPTSRLRSNPNRTQRLVGGVLVGVLAFAVAAPMAVAARYSYDQASLVSSVFKSEKDTKSATRPSGWDADATEAPGEPQPSVDPWAKKPRLNLLLLGGDAGKGRTGTRTDTVIVASIDTKTGDTTLISLPRNTGRMPFPADSPAAQVLPERLHRRRRQQRRVLPQRDVRQRAAHGSRRTCWARPTTSAPT